MEKSDEEKQWMSVIVGAFVAAVFIAVTGLVSVLLWFRQKELEKLKKTKKNGDPQSPAKSREFDKIKKDQFRLILPVIIILTLFSIFMVAVTIACIPTTDKGPKTVVQDAPLRPYRRRSY